MNHGRALAISITSIAAASAFAVPAIAAGVVAVSAFGKVSKLVIIIAARALAISITSIAAASAVAVQAIAAGVVGSVPLNAEEAPFGVPAFLFVFLLRRGETNVHLLATTVAASRAGVVAFVVTALRAGVAVARALEPSFGVPLLLLLMESFGNHY